MDKSNSEEDSDNIDWNTEDELEIQDDAPSSVFRDNGDNDIGGNNGEGGLSVSVSNPMIQHFVGMGFPEKLVSKAIDENGEVDTDSILNALLTYSVLDNSPVHENSSPLQGSPQQQLCVTSDFSSSEYQENLAEDLSDVDSWSNNEIPENVDSLSDKQRMLRSLANMGYTIEEASIAMERCGPESSISELTDFICAAQMARAEDALLPEFDDKPSISSSSGKKKRKLHEVYRKRERVVLSEDNELIRIPKPMIGYGVPSAEPHEIISRSLPESAIGPPFFYYENVALAPKGVWDTISRFLHDIEPEFVDSKYFCAAARKRGYVHNLPIENRFPLIPLPPMTIQESFPMSRRWWPSWDPRTKLNCIQTAIASAKLTERIRKALENYDGEPPQHVQKYVLDECRKWNLVWVGRNKVAPLEPSEIEMLLGFPKDHTRGGGISRTDRYKSLGNSFQVDTVAYHLSVLKELFPGGINLLSLFSGIGGAEIALHRLGIPLKNVVSVEKSKGNRDIVRSWWEQTNQRGILVDFDDVQLLNGDRLEEIIHSVGGIDLVIGGSPCNNLAGSNRVSRDGLEGTESSLFFDYCRILDLVKCVMSRRQ